MPGEIRFHLDECVPQAVGDGLRRRGIDVTFGTKREQSGDDDERVLRFATAEERVLVTQDADYSIDVLQVTRRYWSLGARS